MASGKADIWMPLYIADYLADTMRLSTEQHGAYLLLLMDYWRSGPLPDDDTVLAQVTRMTPNAWSNARSICQAFFVVRDGHWHHGRADKEMAKAKDKKWSAKAKAEAAAAARWAKNASRNASSIQQAMLEQCPSPSPSPITKKDQNQKIRAPRLIGPEFESFWQAYPRKTAKAAAEKAWLKLSPDEPLLTEIMAGLARAATSPSWLADGGQFIPHPATWLNGRRWTDEPTKINGGADGKRQGPMSAPDRVRAAIAASKTGSGSDQQNSRIFEHE